MPVWAMWAMAGGMMAIGLSFLLSGAGLLGLVIDANSKGKLPIDSKDFKKAFRKSALFIFLGFVVVFCSCGLLVGSVL